MDKNIAYDLWLGPAQVKPIFRKSLHYDWHWDWNTGSGEMGNWGVHVLDDVRNNVFLDKVTLPQKIFGGGGRVVWNDAGGNGAKQILDALCPEECPPAQLCLACEAIL